MKTAIRCALCLLMGATSTAAYAGDGNETTASGYEVAAAQPSDAGSEASTAADEGHGSGEPMRANADTSSDARSSEMAAIDELNRERLNRENWSATP